MLVILIVLGFFTFGGALIGFICFRDLSNTAFYSFMGIAIGLIPSWIIGTLISTLIFGTAPQQLTYTYDLIAMRDDTSIHGSFFLGTGRIDSEMCYVYLIDTEKGMTTKTLKQKDNEVYIKYTDGQPYMEYYGSNHDLWRIPEGDSYYIFYLPEGSIVNNIYEIDLE